MANASEVRKPPTAEEIAAMADRGKDISRFFGRQGKMMPPIYLAHADCNTANLEKYDAEGE